MRTLFVGVFVLLSIGHCLSQTEKSAQPSQNSGTALQLGPSTPHHEFKLDRLPLFTDELSEKKRTFTLKDDMLVREHGELPAETPCYTMRAYMFSSGKEGSAPRPTGYTTCVSSRTLQLRQAQPPVKFMPQ